MKIALGADRAGYPLKEQIKEMLTAQGHTVLDCGAYDDVNATHYPVYAQAVCEKIQNGEAERGILCCGTGIGMSIAANKMRGIRAAEAIARRAGVTGMVAGQVMDVTGEGSEPTLEKVDYIHRHKTADLLTAPIEAGFILAGADDATVAAGCEYGVNLGLAFQMVDDLLDVEGDAAILGKTPGKDAAEGKLTWVAVKGIEETRKDAKSAVEKAISALEMISGDTNFLKTLAQNTLNRVQ